MNDIQIFNNEKFGKIRTVTIDGATWFVARDLSETLGYRETHNMKKILDAEDTMYIDPQSVDFSGFVQNGTSLEPNKNIRRMLITNESGLYSAIINSTLPRAKEFKHWVTSEVLPSIRKTGGYQQKPLTLTEQIQMIATGYLELEKKVDKIETRTEAAETRINGFEDSLPLLPIDADKVSTAVKRRGVELCGGKDSRAYRDIKIRSKVYKHLYNSVKYEFGVSSYKNIPRRHVDKAVEIAKTCDLTIILKEEVEKVNKAA